MKAAFIAAVAAATFIVGLSTARADIWLLNDGTIERRGADGGLVTTIAGPSGVMTNVIQAEVDPFTGNIWIASDQRLTVDSETIRVVGVKPTGEEIWRRARSVSTNSNAPSFAIDPVRHGVWVSLNDNKAVLYDQVTGTALARIRGVTNVKAVGADGAVWVVAVGNRWVRVAGSTVQLDGYEIVGPTGPRHQTFEPGPDLSAPVTIDPLDGGLYFTTRACDPTTDIASGTLLKFSPRGRQLFRITYNRECRSGGFAEGLRVDPRDRSVNVVTSWFDGGIHRVSRLGIPIASEDYTALVNSVAIDPAGIWIGHMPRLDDDLAGIAPMVLRKLDTSLQTVLAVNFPGVIHVIDSIPQPGTMISLDVQPQDEGDVVELSGAVRVALLSSPSFDPLQIDLDTIRFGLAGAAINGHWVRDVNKDAIADLVAVFATLNTGIRCGDTAAPLRARNYDGRAVRGAGGFVTRCAQP